MEPFLSLQPLMRFATAATLLASGSLWLLCCSVPAAANRSWVTFMKGNIQGDSRRMTLRDIDPLGMSPPGDDEEEYVRTRRRFLQSDLDDISPPGMPPSSNDDDGYISHLRRGLLTDLRDISPPGMWPSSDDDDNYVPLRRRNLLSDPANDDDEYVPISRRALLTDLRDISPPGMWPSSDDDYEYVLVRRRALLSDSPDGSVGMLPWDHDTIPSGSPPRPVERFLTPAPNSEIVAPESDESVHIHRGPRGLLFHSLSAPRIWPAHGTNGISHLDHEIGEGLVSDPSENFLKRTPLVPDVREDNDHAVKIQDSAKIPANAEQYFEVGSPAAIFHSGNAQPQDALSRASTSESGSTSNVPSRRPLLGQTTLLSQKRIEPKSHGLKHPGRAEILPEDSFMSLDD